MAAKSAASVYPAMLDKRFSCIFFLIAYVYAFLSVCEQIFLIPSADSSQPCKWGQGVKH